MTFCKKNVIENSLFTVAHRNCNFQFIRTKRFEMIARFNKYSEIELLTGGVHSF